jgi:hypothetical protein
MSVSCTCSFPLVLFCYQAYGTSSVYQGRGQIHKSVTADHHPGHGCPCHEPRPEHVTCLQPDDVASDGPGHCLHPLPSRQYRQLPELAVKPRSWRVPQDPHHPHLGGCRRDWTEGTCFLCSEFANHTGLLSCSWSLSLLLYRIQRESDSR